MIPANQINTLDPNALAGLRRQAKDNSPQALAASAKQFEALFLQMVLKSMREATPSNGLTDNDQTRMCQGLLDQQLAQNLAQQGGMGLAQALVRQLGGAGGSADPAAAAAAGLNPRTLLPARSAVVPARVESPAAAPARVDATPAPAASVPAAASAASTPPASPTPPAAPSATAAPAPPPGSAAAKRAFVERLWPHAEEASRATGIPAHFMIAQAALETGWGKHELRHRDGTPSFNLFNIKAGSRWEGNALQVTATENANGQAVIEKSRFRSYPSYAEAFRDYARLLTSSPRYAEVVGKTDAASFARGLQRAGYATDPMYADKLTRIIGGPSLRNALMA
jgi:flagellar protein FlgJ